MAEVNGVRVLLNIINQEDTEAPPPDALARTSTALAEAATALANAATALDQHSRAPENVMDKAASALRQAATDFARDPPPETASAKDVTTLANDATALAQAATGLAQVATVLAEAPAPETVMDAGAAATALRQAATALDRAATALDQAAPPLDQALAAATAVASAVIAWAQAPAPAAALCHAAAALHEAATALHEAATALHQVATPLDKATTALDQAVTALVARNTCVDRCMRCARCLCFCSWISCRNAPTKPQFVTSDRKTIREMITNENELFNQRRFNFALLQGLLWTSASSLVQKDVNNANLVYILATAGALIALSAAFSFRLTGLAIRTLMNDLKKEKTGDAPVIGLDLFKTNGTDYCLFLCNDPSIMPLILVATWLGFAVMLHFKDPSGPMKIDFGNGTSFLDVNVTSS